MKRIYEYRRHLPHYQSDHKIIFIAFSTHLRWKLPEEARTRALKACLWGNEKRFRLYGVVIMPDHVHLALTPLYDENGYYSVVEITQGIKSSSAHQINHLLNRKGKVWQNESFDHVIRCEENVVQKIEYMAENPVRAGLVQRTENYQWLWIADEFARARTPAPTSLRSFQIILS